MATSHVSAYGTIATFNSTVLGRVTNITADDGAIVLDDTALSDDRENNQLGIDTFSVTIDCLGTSAQVDKGDDGNFVLSGTIAKDFGNSRIMAVGYGAVVKGQTTIRYTIASTNEAAAT